MPLSFFNLRSGDDGAVCHGVLLNNGAVNAEGEQVTVYRISARYFYIRGGHSFGKRGPTREGVPLSFFNLRGGDDGAVCHGVLLNNDAVNAEGEQVTVYRVNGFNIDILARHTLGKVLPSSKSVSLLFWGVGGNDGFAFLVLLSGKFLSVYPVGDGVGGRDLLIVPTESVITHFYFLASTIGNHNVAQRSAVSARFNRSVGKERHACNTSRVAHNCRIRQ